jgi:hypothetical protein
MPKAQKTHRQHHVWQHYLESWSIDDRVWVCREGHIFNTSTENVAVERHFYKVYRLADDEINLIRVILGDQRHPRAKEADNDLWFRLMAPVQIVDQNRERISNIEEVDEHIDVHLTNTLEDYHSENEGRFVPILKLIRNGDLSFLRDQSADIQFFHFVGLQYMRTKGVRERSIQITQEENGLDISRIWPILSIFLGSDLGLNLYLDRTRRQITLVGNCTGVPYVTSDQPVINLDEKPTERFALYYPITPKIALLLSEVDEEPAFSTHTLTAEQVVRLNERMAVASHSQVVADREAALPSISRVHDRRNGHG